jgi:hypothetical protein
MPDSTAYVPFANIVVPSGTNFNLVGYLAGDTGSIQWIDVNDGGSVNQIVIGNPAVTGVPEPTGASLLAVGAAGLLRRRRRRIALRLSPAPL